MARQMWWVVPLFLFNVVHSQVMMDEGSPPILEKELITDPGMNVNVTTGNLTGAPTDRPTQPVQPLTDRTVQPLTGRPADLPTARPADPATGQPADPPTARPADPPTTRPADPPTARPADPPTARPADPPTAKPADPPTARPADPPTARPADPPTARPADPPTARPADPPTARPADPPTARPADPPTARPADPPTARPGDPPTARPADPTPRATQAPTTRRPPEPRPQPGTRPGTRPDMGLPTIGGSPRPTIDPDGTFIPAEIPMTEAQRELNARCTAKCRTELCYLADDNDCRNFLTCQQDGFGRYYAIIQPCAFGTYWAGLQRQKKITCDQPENVICNIEYCRGRTPGHRYDHTDGNCKTYWECDRNGLPQPKCCPEGFFYDDRSKNCTVDISESCHDKCPIKIDACRRFGQLHEFLDDGNCRTFWDCEKRHPHPVCCPEGQGYHAEMGCIPDVKCQDPCPKQYQSDSCLQPGVEKYSLIDGSCRTYMKCNAVDGDERWCCPSNYVFDSNLQECIEKTPDMDLTCDDFCPMNFSEVCHLKAAANPAEFLMLIHGVETPRPCAPGTLFDISKCGCAKPVANAPDNSCNMELDIVFDAPFYTRTGSQAATEIIQIGQVQEGPKLNGRTSYRFSGDLYHRIPFFQSQYEQFYINLIYNPESTVTTGKQVLLSNCMNIDLGAPTLELSLENGRAVLKLVTDAIIANATNVETRPVVASVPYTPGVWNKFIAIYNGQDVYLLNEGTGAPTFDRQSMQGAISVAAEGLDFGGCAINRAQREGFVGSLAQLQFSKCLKQEWIDNFNAATTALTP